MRPALSPGGVSLFCPLVQTPVLGQEETPLEVDTQREDAINADLDRLIARRASTDHGTTADEQEELWKMSVRAHNARIRDENREAWLDYHRGQAERLRRNLASLIAHHEEQASKLQEGTA